MKTFMANARKNAPPKIKSEEQLERGRAYAAAYRKRMKEKKADEDEDRGGAKGQPGNTK